MSSGAERPAEVIERFYNERQSRSDDEILRELTDFPPLADEATWYKTADWSEIFRFLALADVCAERRLRPAVRLLLEKVCFGDPGETMRGLRHSVEAIAQPDRNFLADECVAALTSERPGTRYWAIDELAVLKMRRTIPPLELCLNDPESEIREQAQWAIETIQEYGE